MRWTERQRAMLREMGIPAFWPVEDAPIDAAGAEPAQSSPADRATARPDRAWTPTDTASHTQGDGASAHARPATPGQASPPAGQPAAAPTAATPPARSPAGRAAPATGRARPGQGGMQAIGDIALGVRPHGIETMDWPALREAVLGCQACGLSQSRTQAVFGVGHPHADWMIVGEAPGEQEDKQGEPFVGRAGQLLDRMLAALGLTRSEAPPAQQVFIANVLKCRPPANRNPLPQEVAQCEPYLLRQIELVKPRIILAMGRFAVQSLLKSSEPIGKLRGRVHEVAGVPVVVSYHPAYLLRSPADKAQAWDDLCLAREVLRSASAR